MKYKNLIVIFLCFTIYFVLDDLYFKSLRALLNGFIDQMGISHNITYFISGLPLFIGVLLLDKPQNFFNHLGMNTSIVKGFLFALICTAPMFIGFAFLFQFNKELTINEFLISGLAAAFFEELYFRGYLFGITFKFTRLGFVLSIITGAILFAAIHLYQSQDLGTLIGIFITTFIGAIIFAWTYIEWKFNIWVPIGLHLFMNISWMLFSVSDNALGGVYANVFRIITLILVFAFTFIYKKLNKHPFYVTKQNIWLHQKNNLIEIR